MQRHIICSLALAVLATAAGAAPPPRGNPVYAKDVAFALKELEKTCGSFFRLKGIDWKAVKREFAEAAGAVESDGEHWKLLTRLVARLKDGHAAVRPGEKGRNVAWPDSEKPAQSGPGMFWCRIGDRIHVKNVWSAAKDAGVEAGMQVVEVEGIPADRWIEKRMLERSDLMGFSTGQQAFYAACHWGLAGDQGGVLDVVLRGVDGRRKKARITRRRASTVPSGPVFPPAGLATLGRQSYGKTGAGNGYIHLRDIPGELPGQLDTMLAAIGDAPGLILDLRANGGGGVDHEAVLGRFVPEGKMFARTSAPAIESAGPNPYGGPVVVILDAGVRSAGETIAAVFVQDGRAYGIGESSTAGMSSAKTAIELPSGLFNLYVSHRSNLGRANGGKGIEGIGIPPHEVTPYDPLDLSKGIDTQIRRAEEILEDFPWEKIRYRMR